MGKKIKKTGSLEKRKKSKKLSRGSKNSILIRDLREKKINRKKNKHKSK